MDSGLREFGITGDRASIHPFDLVELLIQRHQLREMIFQGGLGNIEGIHDLLSSFTFGDHGAKFHGVKFRCDRHG